MKTNSLNRISLLALAIALGFSHAALAQATVADSVPTTVAPMQPAADPINPPKPLSDSRAEVPSADSVLSKLKQNSSPVTINDMIAAQDVLSRLDLIGQIEDKMAKIDEARAKHAEASFPSGLSNAPGSAASLANSGAAEALKRASGSHISSMGYYGGPPQVLAVSGAGGDYSALLQVDGHPLNVKNGSTVPGLGTVSSIDTKQILVLKPDGKTAKLSFTQN